MTTPVDRAPGRPPDRGVAADQAVRVLLTPDEVADLKARAGGKGQVGAYIRRRVFAPEGLPVEQVRALVTAWRTACADRLGCAPERLTDERLATWLGPKFAPVLAACLALASP